MSKDLYLNCNQAFYFNQVVSTFSASEKTLTAVTLLAPEIYFVFVIETSKPVKL